MRAMLQRIFSGKKEPPETPAPAAPWAMSSELTHGDIESYYLRVITECLSRMLVPADAIEVSVKRAGTGPSGLTAFAGYVRLLKWDPVLTPVLLQNMAVIDARIRKVVAASVILEHTHFSGLWFQSTDSTQGAPDTLVGMPARLLRQAGGD